jgi:uncharacterized membrane protein YqjE
MEEPMSTQSEPRRRDRTLAELFEDLSDVLRRLVRAEIALAKAELAGRFQALGAGVGLLVGAGVLALYLLAAVIATSILVLSIWLDAWAAALIVTVVLLLVVALLAFLGIRKLKHGSPPTPVLAVENVQLDVAALQEGIGR